MGICSGDVLGWNSRVGISVWGCSRWKIQAGNSRLEFWSREFQVGIPGRNSRWEFQSTGLQMGISGWGFQVGILDEKCGWEGLWDSGIPWDLGGNEG